jgi:hypothetical protein
MKHKKPVGPLADLLPAADRLVGSGPLVFRTPKSGKCVICGDPVAPFSEEDLCWVCRRLKISAWKDAEVQPQAPE